MDKSAEPFEALKQILRQAREPERLDNHPWARGLIVQEALAGNPVPVPVSPGAQLLQALARLFSQLQPASPPRRGKRLDPRWGEFGLLAALYFTPFKHGTPFPATLLEAWARIDEAILFFVFGRPAAELCEAEVKRYQLVGADVDYGSASTLSDWHRKGLQRFTELILNRERFLARSTGSRSTLLNPPTTEADPAPQARTRRLFGWASLLLLVTALTLGALRAWRIYERGRLVYQEVLALEALVSGPVELETFQTAIPALTGLRGDLSHLKEEAGFLLWAAPKLNWLPTYGPDLAAAPALMETAEHLLDASLLASEAAQPLLTEFNTAGSAHDLASLTARLVEAQPQFQAARGELDRALTARATLEAERLSPRLHDLLVDQLDPVLKLSDESLSLALAMPNLLGAGSDGPKTYLLLAQNEDELRPTGGFITSVGNLVLHKGQVISLGFERVDDNVQEDWSRPYPSAPWQLQEYMNSRVLILRDSNWFTDFPTTALWAEYLYAYTHSHSVDGVIAFDQHFLVMLLGELGPLEVEGAPYPLTEANVIEYMRQAKNPPAGEALTAPWYRKEFISRIAEALLLEVRAGESHDWRGLAGVLSQALAERHLLLQFDEPVITNLLAERSWDNAVRAGAGDYLMAADTNVGFNKTSALVEVSLAYDVDLTDLAAPEAHLNVTHRNTADHVPCIQWDTGYITGEDMYPLNRCYWSYLRVYRPAGVELLEATPHAIPGGQLLLGRGVPARVDELDEELQGVRGYGTLLVVPGGETWHTGFDFALPPTVLSGTEVPNQWVYRLRVQKQPGTLAVPITLRIHLPPHAALVSVSREAVVQGGNLLIEADLRTDLALELIFNAP